MFKSRAARQSASPPGSRLSTDEVFSENAPFAWRVLRGLGVAEADVDDVCQEVFITVHRRLPDFEGRSTVRTWVYGICVRAAADYRKRVRTRREVGATAPPELAVAPRQEDAVSIQQARDTLHGILDRLDDDKRAVFVLYENRGACHGRCRERRGVPSADGLFAPSRRPARGRRSRRTAPGARLLEGTMSDPKRLIDPDSRSSPKVRVLLRIARAELPSEDRIAGIEASLGAFLAGVHGGPTHAGGTASGGSAGAGTALGGLKAATAAKFGAAALVTLGVAATGYVETRGAGPSNAKALAAAASVASSASVPASAPAAGFAAPYLAEPAPVPGPSSAAPTSTPPPSPTGKLHAADGDSEIALLDAAQATLASDPATALSLANRHAARFPSGLLLQEREVIAIEALSRLGRDDEARRRAHRFDQDFPRSAHRPRIDALVGDGTSPHNP